MSFIEKSVSVSVLRLLAVCCWCVIDRQQLPLKLLMPLIK